MPVAQKEKEKEKEDNHTDGDKCDEEEAVRLISQLEDAIKKHATEEQQL